MKLFELFDSEPLVYEIIKDEVSNKVITFTDERDHVYKLWVYKKPKFGKDVWVALLSEKGASSKSYKRILGKFKDPKTIVSTLISIFKNLKTNYGNKIKGIMFELPASAFGSYSNFVKKILTRELKKEYSIPNVDYTDDELAELDLVGIPMVAKPNTFKSIFKLGTEVELNIDSFDDIAVNQIVTIDPQIKDQKVVINIDTDTDKKSDIKSKTIKDSVMPNIPNVDKIAKLQSITKSIQHTPDLGSDKKIKQNSLSLVDIEKNLSSYKIVNDSSEERNKVAKSYLDYMIQENNITFETKSDDELVIIKKEAIIAHLVEQFKLTEYISHLDNDRLINYFDELENCINIKYKDKTGLGVSIIDDLNKIDPLIFVVLLFTKGYKPTFGVLKMLKLDEADSFKSFIGKSFSLGTIFTNDGIEYFDSVMPKQFKDELPLELLYSTYEDYKLLDRKYFKNPTTIFDGVENPYSILETSTIKDMIGSSNNKRKELILRLLASKSDLYDIHSPDNMIANIIDPDTGKSYKGIASNDLTETIIERAFQKSNYLIPEEVTILKKILPSIYVKDLNTPFNEFFELRFLEAWTASSSGEAHMQAFNALQDFGPNDNGLRYYKGLFENRETETIKVFKENDYSKKYEYIKNRTYDKLKKKYKTGTVTLYRGIQINNTTVTKYNPGTLESWTDSPNAAKKFSSVYILKAEVPIEGILSYYGMFREFYDANRFYGEKEFIVFGGILKNCEVHLLEKLAFKGKDYNGTSTVVKTFEEFSILDDKFEELSILEIVTYSDDKLSDIKTGNLLTGALK